MPDSLYVARNRLLESGAGAMSEILITVSTRLVCSQVSPLSTLREKALSSRGIPGLWPVPQKAMRPW
jgi:hypothetical protein